MYMNKQGNNTNVEYPMNWGHRPDNATSAKTMCVHATQAYLNLQIAITS